MVCLKCNEVCKPYFKEMLFKLIQSKALDSRFRARKPIKMAPLACPAFVINDKSNEQTLLIDFISFFDFYGNRLKKALYYLEINMEYSVTKQQLIKIVSTCQERSYAQEVELLAEKGDNLEWILNGLCSHTKNGISNEQSDLEKRKKLYGSNEKEIKEPPGLLELFCEALEDFMLRVLICAALLSIALEVGTANPEDRSKAWVEGFAVLLAVFVCAFVTSVNDYQKERQFIKLNNAANQKKKVTVRRNGINMQIHQDYLLVGDLISISQGMDIPADGILLQANQITTDESAMTGESDPVKKNILKSCLKKKELIDSNGEKNIATKHTIPSPILMSGTKILTGEGKMVVLVVGQSSCIGKIRALLEKEDPQPTPLQQKLQKLATDIGKFGLYSAIVIILVLLVRFAVEKGITKEWNTAKDLLDIVNFFMLGITVIVVAIPEGLPLSVTISLAFSVKKMLDDQNLVRRMEACETMGGANNICSDKTGTLTMNKMTLDQIWNKETKQVDLYKEKLEESDLSTNKQFNELFMIASMVNSTAQLEPEEKGSSTEVAILKYFKRMGINYQTYKQKYEIKFKIPFSSARKRMSVVLQHKDSNCLFIKGASEIILQSCNEWFNSTTGQLQTISPKFKVELQNAITKMAEASLRTLCLGYKRLAVRDDLQTKDEKGVFNCEKDNIILLGIIGVRDIPRKQVPDAIIKCHRAGIIVRMVTGDNIVTAKAIAKDIGIIQEGKQFLALEGPQFNKLVGGIVCKKCRTAICDCPTIQKKADEEGAQLRVDTVANAEQFDKIQHKLLVLARSRPEDKYCLVTGLKERGNIVAVTGDGTNDAPALKKADVGFAMGICGTQVARDASAIILIDDNFSSIVKAVLWGRNIYDSIRKFVQFQLTVNVVAVGSTFISASILQAQVLKPIQMLWINLIMDTLASLALATEKPTQELLNRKPHSREEYIISKSMIKHILGQSLFQLIVLIVLIFYGDQFIPEYVDSYDTTTFAGRPQYKWLNGVVGGTVRSGRFYTIAGDYDYRTVYDATKIYSRHYTFIFNTFVMMQIFNFLNSRKLHEEFNIFEGITRNPLFIIIVIGIIMLQIILISFTGPAFGVYSNYGLTVYQWLITIAIGSISLIVSILLKLIPYGKHQQHENESAPIVSKVGEMRKKSVLSLKRIQQRVERDLAKNHIGL